MKFTKGKGPSNGFKDRVQSKSKPFQSKRTDGENQAKHFVKRDIPKRDPNRVTNYSKNQEKRREKEENLKLYRHKVFIDGLPFQQTDETDAELYDLCFKVKAKGAIRLVQKKGYGFGYLVFHTNEQAQRAVPLLDGQTHFGRKLRAEPPKAPDAAKSEDVANRAERTKSMFQRQILLLNLPRFINEDILIDALRDYFRHSPFEGSVEGLKVLRKEKAFVTFTESFEGKIQEILTALSQSPLQILGTTVDAVKALSPRETCGKQPVNDISREGESEKNDKHTEEPSSKKAKRTSAELDKLRRMTKSKKSYSFLLQEIGDASDPKIFREEFCERFNIDDEKDVTELTSVNTNLHGRSTGLWKVNVGRYLVAQKILTMCTQGKEEGKVRVEMMTE